MQKYLVSIVVLLVCSLSFSQSKKDVLLTVNEKPVYVSEFIRVYNKNLDLVKDESQKSVDGYLDLFIDYNLKIAEAYEQKLDQEKEYITEFTKYRDQLSHNYIFEEKVTNELTKEAYERGLEEINANHILIRVDYEDSPKDTLIAYNKIKGIYDRAKAGEDFETLVKTYSEEPNAKKTAGKLGYFSVFSMVYPFETMAYKTKTGDVSEIVRTQFGYHIIKVNERRKRGEQISVSHIMISDNGGERTFDPEERIHELQALLKQGESFESLAQQYSDDKNSAKKGGKLQKFRRGDLRAPEFEEAAFKLNSVGEVSEPIKTKFGWHIIKLDEKHAIPTFEEEKEGLVQKLQNGMRSKIVASALNDKIKGKFNYKEMNDYLPFFSTYITEKIFEKDWKYDPLPEAQNKVIFTIGEKQVRYNDFGLYINANKSSIGASKQKVNLLEKFYNDFETDQLLDYYKKHLEFDNEEYGATISEYRNGLLIFDLMNKNIWEKAKNDTIGLKKYYEDVKENYRWDDRVKSVIYSTTSNAVAQEVVQLIAEGKTSEEIKISLNTDSKVNVIVSEGVFEKGKRELPENFEVASGVSKIYENNDRFIIVDVAEVIPSGVKELNSIKGKVMSDYQSYIETQWMDGLRKKYKVEVNNKALKKVKKELKS